MDGLPLPDPASVGRLLSAAEKLEKLVGSEPAVKFGVATAREEQCARVHVFMRLVGRSSSELRRDVAPPTASAEQMLARFAAMRREPTEQRVIRDENGFELSARLREGPLVDLSSGCRLNLLFTREKSVGEEAITLPESFVRDGTSWMRRRLQGSERAPAPLDRRDRTD